MGKIFVLALSFVVSFHITETHKLESKAPITNNTQAISEADIQDLDLKQVHETLSDFSSEQLDEVIAENQNLKEEGSYLGTCTRWRIVDRYCEAYYGCYYGKKNTYIYSRTCFWGVETKSVYGSCCKYYW